MANPWFRLYHEWDSDPKVQSLSEEMQRRLIMLFCSRCRCETLLERDRAFHWRITDGELAKTKAVFLEKGFIDEDWNLLNWNKRQFLSDSSTERVRRYRQAMKQDETLHTVTRNVTVTAPDTDTESDTKEKKQTKQVPLAPTSGEVETGVFDLPLPGKQGEWSVPADLYTEMVKLHPGVSVMGELAGMRSWLITHPTKRKTKKGMPAFISNWLGRAQNNQKPTQGARPNGKPNRNDEILTGAQEYANSIRNRDVAPPAPYSGRTLEAGATTERAGAGDDPALVAQNSLGDR